MRLDLYGSESHFRDHLRAVHEALPLTVRGNLIDSLEQADPANAVMVASYGDLRKARRVYSRLGYLEHGAGQSYAGEQVTARRSGYAGGNDCSDVGIFLVPGEYPAARWRRAYPRARVEVVGSPKVDALPRLDPSVPRGTVALGFQPEPIVAVGWHWQAGVTQETRTAFAYYRPVLHALSKKFHVIGHGHPRGVNNEPHWPRAYSRMGIEWVPDFQEVCRRASVYVCDNSSTLFEFAATGRPVVVANAPFYRRSVDHGGRFWDWATVGPQVDRPSDLEGAVAAALDETPSQAAERERISDLVYSHRGDAADRAVSALLDWLGARVPVTV